MAYGSIVYCLSWTVLNWTSGIGGLGLECGNEALNDSPTLELKGGRGGVIVGGGWWGSQATIYTPLNERKGGRKGKRGEGGRGGCEEG